MERLRQRLLRRLQAKPAFKAAFAAAFVNARLGGAFGERLEGKLRVGLGGLVGGLSAHALDAFVFQAQATSVLTMQNTQRSIATSRQFVRFAIREDARSTQGVEGGFWLAALCFRPLFSFLNLDPLLQVRHRDGWPSLLRGRAASIMMSRSRYG